MTRYEVIEFERSFEAPEQAAVVGVSLTEAGTRTTASQRNLALLAFPDADDDATPERIVCGYETDNGECQRQVSEEDERCWQHEDSE